MNITRRILPALALTLMLCATAALRAQSNSQHQYLYCRGWHNPTGFNGSHVGGVAETQWNGLITSNKTGVPGTHSNGVPWIEAGATYVNADDLATTVSGSCHTNYQSTSLNVAGQQDTPNRFVIKGQGTAPETNGGLTYTPATYVGNSATLDTNYVRSIRLGNYCYNHEAEALQYTMEVLPENALLTLWYALSLEPGSGHTWSGNNNPSSEIVIYVENFRPTYDAQGNQVGGTWNRLGNDTLFYSQVAPTGESTDAQLASEGFYRGSSSPQNFYMRWHKVVINLYKYLHERVRITIASGDCSYSAHYGLCYIAGDCAPMELSTSGCAAGETNAVTSVSAPVGMNTYQWYRSRYGQLTPAQAIDTNNFVRIQGATDSVYGATTEDLQRDSLGANGRTYTVNCASTTLMCKMTSLMNQNPRPTPPNQNAYPWVVSFLSTNVNNSKPTIVLDTVLVDCEGNIELTDHSKCYSPRSDEDQVDPNYTTWQFFDSSQPIAGESPIAVNGQTTQHGSSATAHFSTPGHHRVRVKIASYATDPETHERSCWNQKDIVIRTMTRPEVTVAPYDEVVCAGDEVAFINTTEYTVDGRTYRIGVWPAEAPGATTFIYPSNDNRGEFDTTVAQTVAWGVSYDENYEVTVQTFFKNLYWERENEQGELIKHYCVGSGTFPVRVEQWPEPQIAGDTVVCYGREATLLATTGDPSCDYTWYLLGSDAEIGTGAQYHINRVETDNTFVVKAYTPHGCDGWDTLKIRILSPEMDYRTKYLRAEICEGDTATLWGTNALSYHWYSQPEDISMWDQEENATINVTPSRTTLYKLVGYGANPDVCYADTLYQEIVVYPYPKLQVRLTPDYIDSDNPAVQFSDISEYGTGSRWIFGDQDTSYIRSVVWHFDDLSEEIVHVDLRSFNPLSCYRDTNFWVPINVFSVWYPNAFTPRLESNNTFHAYTANQLQEYELNVYDRAGALVFHSNDPEEAWNGTYNGALCKQGIYVWRATYKRDNVDRVINQKGTVLLIL